MNMQLGFFTQPIHPKDRSYPETLAEDREIFCLADRLGYSEAFCGEHLFDLGENVPNSLMFIASLAAITKTIKLGTGVHNLPFSHPAVVASNAAMVDNLLQGRFLFGIGAGISRADAESLEVLDKDRNEMFEEAIDQVLALWNGAPPYDIKGKYWNISTARSSWPELGIGEMVKPFQKPHPPILAASGDAQSKRVASFGARGWSLISSDTIPGARLAEHWRGYAEGCASAGRVADPSTWRVVRSIFVADDATVAQSYGKRDHRSPYREHFHHFHMKFSKGRILHVFKTDLSVPDEQVTLDYAVDNCVIAGTVSQVIDAILELYDQAGPFGTLLYAGKNWTDPALSKRSMELMAEKVMPAVNAALGRAIAAE
jgi:alkanesulfonate monooxygenase SsuD/methylene tetrahydromethanopterin reductase-like flavin-dependent oxidoreductase (luciferase family)